MFMVSDFTLLTSQVSMSQLHVYMHAAAAKSLQQCPTMCDPIDGSPPGYSLHGILQARILEWVAISFSNACMHAQSLQWYPTLCDSRDSRPPGSSAHRILQARILEWVAIPFSWIYAYIHTYTYQDSKKTVQAETIKYT